MVNRIIEGLMKHKKTRCSKCKTFNPIVESHYSNGKTFSFCELCHIVFTKHPYMPHLLDEFLRDDFGDFPVSQVERNMINGRINRTKGKGKWKKKDE